MHGDGIERIEVVGFQDRPPVARPSPSKGTCKNCGLIAAFLRHFPKGNAAPLDPASKNGANRIEREGERSRGDLWKAGYSEFIVLFLLLCGFAG